MDKVNILNDIMGCRAAAHARITEPNRFTCILFLVGFGAVTNLHLIIAHWKKGG